MISYLNAPVSDILSSVSVCRSRVRWSSLRARCTTFVGMWKFIATFKKAHQVCCSCSPLGPLKIWVILRSKDFLVVTAMSSVKGIPSLATTLKWCPLIKLAPRGWFWYNDALWVVGEFSFVYLSNIYIYIYIKFPRWYYTYLYIFL